MGLQAFTKTSYSDDKNKSEYFLSYYKADQSIL